MKVKIGLMLLLSFMLWAGGRTYQGVRYTQQCGGYIKRAIHSNAIDTTQTELKRAILWLEREGITQGYTSVLWKTPDEDVAFWYNNLKAGLAELEGLPVESSPLERSNVLMRLREALSKTPEGIAIYPHNAAWFWFGWLSLSLAIAGCVLLIQRFNDYLDSGS